MNETLNTIAARHSTRAFKAEQITAEELAAVLEAGKLAPSSLNRQPWFFTVIQNKALLDRMVRDNKEIVLANENFKRVAGWVNAPNYNNFYNAPTVIVISGHAENPFHVCDCALAMQNMSIAAEALGLGSCIIASTRFLFMTDKAAAYRAELKIPEGYDPLYMLSLGYPAAPAKATPRNADVVTIIE